MKPTRTSTHTKKKKSKQEIHTNLTNLKMLARHVSGKQTNKESISQSRPTPYVGTLFELKIPDFSHTTPDFCMQR